MSEGVKYHTPGFVRLADWKGTRACLDTGLKSLEDPYGMEWSGWMGFRCKEDAEEFVRRWNAHESLVALCDQLQRFKSYVHARLDAAGVSADPESPHKAEGCRIGGRLDEVLAERDCLRERDAELLRLSLDINRLRSGNYRAAHAENQWLCDIKAQRDALLAACEAVADFADCEDAADWKDAWGRLTSLCGRASRAAKPVKEG